jgi:hypothetical protein
MTLVLELIEFTKKKIMECDTLGKGIRAVLRQYGRPLAFTSKQLSEIHFG